MRVIIFAAAAAFFALPTPSFAEGPSDHDPQRAAAQDNAEDADEDDAEAEREARAEAIQQTWGSIFAAPGQHQWEFELGGGAMYWETAFGGEQHESYYRARARKYLRDPFAVSLALDFTRQAPTTGTLEFSEQRTAFLASFDVHHWFGRWLLGVGAEAGPQWSRRTIDDVTGEVDTSNRFDPALGLVGRAGVSLFGTASLSLEGGLRWYPMRLDELVLLQVGWLL